MDQKAIQQFAARIIEQPESEVLEFKEAKTNFKTADIGRYFSALSNEANLQGASSAWLVFGVRDDRTICGTAYRQESGSESLGLQRLKREIPNETNNRITFRAIYETQLEGKRIILFEIPAATRGIPTLWAGSAYSREHESLVPLSLSKIDEIRSQPPLEWGKLIAELDGVELDIESLNIVRQKMRARYGDRENLINDITDEELLDKCGLTLRGKITNTALMLIGQRSEKFLFDGPTPTLTWTLYEGDNVERAYEHIRPPFIRGIDEVLSKIRNERIRIMDNYETLLPTELTEYDAWSLRELIGNAIAHQDYSQGRRVHIEEFSDRIVIMNEGSFIPETIEKALEPGYKPPRYRNPFLCEAMLHIGMLDQNAMGIRAVFEACRRRHMPLPTYDLTDPNRVKVTLFNHEIDPVYGQILQANPELPMSEIVLLDKVQKYMALSEEEIHKVIADGFARYGRDDVLELIAPYVVDSDIFPDNQAVRNAQLAVGNNLLREAIIEILHSGSKSRNVIVDALQEEWSNVYESQAKLASKVYRTLAAMERQGIVQSEGNTRARIWSLRK